MGEQSADPVGFRLDLTEPESPEESSQSADCSEEQDSWSCLQVDWVHCQQHHYLCRRKGGPRATGPSFCTATLQDWVRGFLTQTTPSRTTSSEVVVSYFYSRIPAIPAAT